MARYLICYIGQGNALTVYRDTQNPHDAKKIVEGRKDMQLFVIDRGAEPVG